MDIIVKKDLDENNNVTSYHYTFSFTEEERQIAVFSEYELSLINLVKKSGTISGKLLALNIFAKCVEDLMSNEPKRRRLHEQRDNQRKENEKKEKQQG